MMKKILIIYIVSIFVVSCTILKTDKIHLDRIILEKPSPILVEKVNWHVLDGNICLTAVDGVKLNMQLKDTLRYVKNLQSRLCYMGDTKYCNDEK